MQIKEGLANYFRPYQAVILPTTTNIEKLNYLKFGGGAWQFQEDYDVIVQAKRLQRDQVNLQLGNVEREIQRIVCTYKPNDIPGVDDMHYGGQERLYDSENYAKSNWSSRIAIRIFYLMVNEQPFT